MIRPIERKDEAELTSYSNRLVIWVLLLLLLLPLAGLTQAEPVYACDCAIPQNATDALAENAAVFRGEVLAMKRSKWTGEYDETYDAVLLEVDQIWKGVEQSQIVVYNPISSCQYEFKAGDSYLIYSNVNGGELVVSNCSRTAEISQASVDLNELGPGEQPSQQINLFTSFHAASWFNGAVITILAIVLILLPIAGLVYRYRVRK